MCIDNKTEKIYLVRFGNSDLYLLRDTEAGEKSYLTRIEAELNAFLRKKFQNENFAYYTHPRVDEVSPMDAAKYENLPPLDEKAMASIKEVLAREVTDMQDTKELNSDAPFSNVNPAAADIPHILG